MKKSETKNEILLKENNNLRKELKEMIVQVKFVANKCSIEDNEKRVIKRINHKKNTMILKENQPP